MDFNKQLMHKKLEKDLISIAHDILKMKNREDIFALKEKSRAVFEKISMLAFVEEYVNTTPNLQATKEQLINEVENAFEAKESFLEEIKTTENEAQLLSEKIEIEVEETTKIEADIVTETKEVEKVAPVIEQPFDELEAILFSENNNPTNFKNDVKDVGERKTPTLEDELQDTISVDIMADLFENAQPKSLNDRLVNSIQIGLNDRIAFVKNLFNGEQEDFNRVVSQLNSFKTEKEAKKFIEKMVKPDYNWSNHEALEQRFFEIIERKFA